MTDAALPISELLLAGLGGGLGAGLRVWLRSMAVRRMHGTWRVTLGVNALGSILIGLMAAPLVDAPMLRALLVPGVLGGFTTFSAFSLETLMMIERRAWAQAGLYAVLSVLLSTAAVFLGLLIMRRWAA